VNKPVSPPVTGERQHDFEGLTIRYDERVLAPRDWTAAQSRWAAELIGSAPPGPVLELCAGAGQIGLLAIAGTAHRLVAVDADPVACEFVRTNARAAGLADRVEIRVQDYRDVDDGPYDRISSVGMFEHVGLSQLQVYFDRLYALLAPEGRLLNHGISRPKPGRSGFSRRGFIDRYVFPDGELHEVGTVISTLQRSGFEARHMESIREHYALTLRAWVANLEANWDAAVAEVGEGTARVWGLYMAGSRLAFERNEIQLHHVLATKTDDDGEVAYPIRPTFPADASYPTA
jgi:cyclopropane-fatty-acyl-phospholipid synthase